MAGNVAQGLQLGTDLTGIDLAGLLRRLGGAANAGVVNGVTHVPLTSTATARPRATALVPDAVLVPAGRRRPGRRRLPGPLIRHRADRATALLAQVDGRS